MVLNEDIQNGSIMANQFRRFVKPLSCLGRPLFGLALCHGLGDYLLRIFQARRAGQKFLLVVFQALALLDMPSRGFVGASGHIELILT